MIGSGSLTWKVTPTLIDFLSSYWWSIIDRIEILTRHVTCAYLYTDGEETVLIFLVEAPLHTCYLNQCSKFESSELAVCWMKLFFSKLKEKKERWKLTVYWLRLVQLITLILDESRNISGIGTGALVVLRSAISFRFTIPISNPELDIICCNELNWRWAILSISDDVPAPTAEKVDVLVANIWRSKCEVRT